MNYLRQDFVSHILSQEIPGCEITLVDDEHIALATSDAKGEVNFYAFEGAPDIVELRIEDLDRPEEPTFFLHFELEDEDRAEELFAQMAEALQERDFYETRRILLCCTAGLTTTMFANKLAEAAKTLSLDYSFEALPLAQAQEQGGDYDVVLLAPQVAYQRSEVAAAFPEAVVVVIPAKVFAAYDAGAALKMVMHLLSDHTVFPIDDGSNLKFARDLPNDATIMVLTVINRPRSSWIGWRIYIKGEIATYGSVTKPKNDLRDVEDVLATLHFKGWDPGSLDAIGIAVPGIVNRGTIAFAGNGVTDYELGRLLSERYHAKVFVDNNANAAAVGCYMSQDNYDSVVLHTQQTGFLVGGQGIVVDGHLLKGRRNFAGELGPLSAALRGHEITSQDLDLAWSPEGMRKIVAPALAADVSLVAPDAIYLAVDLLDDMDALRDEVARYFGDALDPYIPDLIRVGDYRETIALGELALCLQKLHNPRPHRKH